MNVEELLQTKDIQYVPKGADFEVRCLNPKHEDKHPSMRIDKVTGIFNCFSCDFKGNLFTLYGERVNLLQQKRDLLIKKIKNKVAESIGLAFPTSFIPYEGDWRNIKPETYKKFEAFTCHDKDYVGRVLFPIRDISGRISAFNGRHMSGGLPKYLISPAGAKMPLFPQVHPIKGTVILVEGIFDMLNLYDKGLTNTICCHGTRNVNEDKLSVLRIQGIEEVYIFFDGDEPGQKAAESIKIMCENLDLATKNICLDDSDPGELTAAQVEGLTRRLYHV